MKNKNIEVLGTDIKISKINENDYICITDIAKYKSDRPDLVIQNWIRTSITIQFLWLWEKLNNNNFNPFTYEGVKNDSIENSFIMTPKSG